MSRINPWDSWVTSQSPPSHGSPDQSYPLEHGFHPGYVQLHPYFLFFVKLRPLSGFQVVLIIWVYFSSSGLVLSRKIFLAYSWVQAFLASGCLLSRLTLFLPLDSEFCPVLFPADRVTRSAPSIDPAHFPVCIFGLVFAALSGVNLDCICHNSVAWYRQEKKVIIDLWLNTEEGKN